MHTKPLIATLLAVAMACGVSAKEAPGIAEAHHAYYLEQFSRSLTIYEKLAATGNAEAAERAGFMLLQGNGLYGRQIKRDVGRAHALLVQAAKAGRPGASFLLNMMERTD